MLKQFISLFFLSSLLCVVVWLAFIAGVIYIFPVFLKFVEPFSSTSFFLAFLSMIVMVFAIFLILRKAIYILELNKFTFDKLSPISRLFAIVSGFLLPILLLILFGK